MIPREASGAVDLVAVLLIAFAIAVFFYLIHVVLLPFVFSGVTAFLLTPLIDRLASKTGLPRLVAAMAMFVVLVALLGLGAYAVAPGLIRGGYHALVNLHGLIERPLRNLVGDGTVEIVGLQVSASGIAAAVVAKAGALLQREDTLTSIALAAFGGVFGLFLTLTLLAYLMASGRQVVRGLIRSFPPDWRPAVALIFARLHPILFRYFAGVAVVVVYASCAALAGLGLFLHLRHAAALAALTGLLEVLPVVGPALSAVGAGLVAVQQAKSVWAIVAYALYATALRLSIDQFIGPLVLGNAARVHPTLIIFCFLAGGAMFGIVGVILAVPVALTVKVALATIYNEPVGGVE